MEKMTHLVMDMWTLDTNLVMEMWTVDTYLVA